MSQRRRLKATLIAGPIRILISQSLLIEHSDKLQQLLDGSADGGEITLRDDISERALNEFMQILLLEERWTPGSGSSVPILLQTFDVAVECEVPVVLDVLAKYFVAMDDKLMQENCFAIEKATKNEGPLVTEGVKMLRQLATGHIERCAQELKDSLEEDKPPVNWTEQLWKSALSSDYLPDIQEVELFQALLLWKNFDSEGRKNAFRSLLELIRIPLMTYEDFTSKVIPAQVLEKMETLNLLTFFVTGNEPDCRFSAEPRTRISQFRILEVRSLRIENSGAETDVNISENMDHDDGLSSEAEILQRRPRKATLVVGSIRIPIPQSLLIEHSDKFQQILDGSADGEEIRLIDDISEGAVYEFMQILLREERWTPGIRSSGSVPILLQTFDVAVEWEVPVVLDVLAKYFVAMDDKEMKESCFTIEKATEDEGLAVTEGVKTLRQKATKHIDRCIQELKVSLEEDKPPVNWTEQLWKSALSSDYLPDIQEVEFFQALLLWKNFDSEGRKNAFRSLLELIRIPLMTYEDFTSKVIPAQVLEKMETLNLLTFFVTGNEPDCRFSAEPRTRISQFRILEVRSLRIENSGAETDENISENMDHDDGLSSDAEMFQEVRSENSGAKGETVILSKSENMDHEDNSSSDVGNSGQLESVEAEPQDGNNSRDSTNCAECNGFPQASQDHNHNTPSSSNGPSTSTARIKQEMEKLGSYSFNVKSPSAIFTGREYEVGKLLSALSDDGNNVVILSSLGGQGTTQLCAQFLKKLKDAPVVTPVMTWFCWENLTNDVIDVCNELSISLSGKTGTLTTISKLAESLARRVRSMPAFIYGNRWIVVLDGVDEKYEDLTPVVGAFVNAGAFVIITTRRVDLPLPQGIPTVELGPMNQQDAIKLVITLAGNMKEKHAQKLCEAWGNHPLALQQAVACIRHRQAKQPNFDVKNYLAELEKGKGLKENPEIQEMTRSWSNYDKSVSHIISIPMDIIKAECKSEPEVGKRAVDLMKILGIVLPEGIHINLLEVFVKTLNWNGKMPRQERADDDDGFSSDEEDDGNHCIDVPSLIIAYTSTHARDDEHLAVSKKALKYLENFSLVKVERNFVSIHPLVQKTTRLMWDETQSFRKLFSCFNVKSATKDELRHFMHVWRQGSQRQDLLTDYIETPLRIFDRMKKLEMILQLKDFAQQNYLLLSSVPGQGPCVEAALKMLKRLGWALDDCGKYRKALRLFEEIYEKKKIMYGENHKRTLKTSYKISVLLWESGLYEKAKERAEKVLQQMIYAYGTEDHVDVYATKHQIALILRDLGKKKEALEIFRKVFDWQSRNNRSDVTLATTRHNIGACLYDLSKLSEAKEEIEAVLEIRKRVLGETNVETLTTKAWLADIVFHMKDLKTAIAIKEEVLHLQKQVLGENHPFVKTSKDAIAKWSKKLKLETQKPSNKRKRKASD